MSTSTTTTAVPRWARVVRERKLVAIGAALSLLFTFALISQVSGASPLQAFSRPSESVVAPASPVGHVVAGSDGASDGLEKLLGPLVPKEEEGFTLVVPTYRRVKDLPKFLANYAEGNISSLRRIILLWNDVENDPPETLLHELEKFKKVPVIVEQRHINSLNQRFRKSENIKTEAVFSLDDDMIFKPSDIQLGFETWKQYGQGRRRMVGYVARETDDHENYMVRDYKTFSMVLTKCSFFHVDWMDLYWSEDRTTTELREYVEKHNNCEDILMAFLHAHYTRDPPIYLNMPFTDKGLVKGISTAPGHLEARSACIREFSKKLGKDTLVSSDLVLTRMKNVKSNDGW